MKKNFHVKYMILIVVVLVAADQLTKYIVKSTMYLGQSIEVLGNFFRLTYVENPGMAMGIRFQNQLVFFGFSIIAAALVFYYLYKIRNEGWVLQLALSFIAAGAIGNLTDRFIYGKVIDFLDFDFFDIHIKSFSILGFNIPSYDLTRFWVFNVADMAVSGGMILIFLYMIFEGDPLKKNSAKNVRTTNV
jgi:signal peptidase II